MAATTTTATTTTAAAAAAAAAEMGLKDELRRPRALPQRASEKVRPSCKRSRPPLPSVERRAQRAELLGIKRCRRRVAIAVEEALFSSLGAGPQRADHRCARDALALRVPLLAALVARALAHVD